jgi:hypothetical protein
MTKSPLINSQNITSVEHWRKRYIKVKNQLQKISSQPVIRLLTDSDKYFDSVNGINDFRNVNRGKAGIAKTSRLVLCLEHVLSMKKVTKNFTFKKCNNGR